VIFGIEATDDCLNKLSNRSGRFKLPDDIEKSFDSEEIAQLKETQQKHLANLEEFTIQGRAQFLKVDQVKDNFHWVGWRQQPGEKTQEIKE